MWKFPRQSSAWYAWWMTWLCIQLMSEFLSSNHTYNIISIISFLHYQYALKFLLKHFLICWIIHEGKGILYYLGAYTAYLVVCPFWKIWIFFQEDCISCLSIQHDIRYYRTELDKYSGSSPSFSSYKAPTILGTLPLSPHLILVTSHRLHLQVHIHSDSTN